MSSTVDITDLSDDQVQRILIEALAWDPVLVKSWTPERRVNTLRTSMKIYEESGWELPEELR